MLAKAMSLYKQLVSLILSNIGNIIYTMEYVQTVYLNVFSTNVWPMSSQLQFTTVIKIIAILKC